MLQNQWIEEILQYGLRAVIPAGLLFLAGWAGIRLSLRLLSGALGNTKLEKGASRLILIFVRFGLWVLLVLLTVSRLGLDVTGVVTFAGVVTLAVSLAIQNALANVFGGFTLLYTHPFRVGDWVEIGGQTGEVAEIGLTYTRLATPDNKWVSIPNNTAVAAQIVNYTAAGRRRLEIPVEVQAEVPAKAVIQALLTAVSGEDNQPKVVILGFDGGNAVYELRFWIQADRYWEALFSTNKAIKENLELLGIIPGGKGVVFRTP